MSDHYIMPEMGKSNEKQFEKIENVIKQQEVVKMSLEEEQTQMQLLQEINSKLDILISSVGGNKNE